MKNDLRYEAILVDLDGTVVNGNTLIEGAAETLKRIRARGVRVLFLSNNASVQAVDIATKIRNLGIDAGPDDALNSASALLKGFRTHGPGARAFVVGQPRLIEALEAEGVTVTEDPLEADFLVTAMDYGFTYDKLAQAQTALIRGATFWATNLDPSLPTEQGLRPGSGSLVAAIATAAGRGPDRVFGKPSPDLAELAMEKLGLPREACLVVGDRMTTDIEFAHNAGMDSALVLTGATRREDLHRFDFSPTSILESIADLESVLD